MAIIVNIIKKHFGKKIIILKQFLIMF